MAYKPYSMEDLLNTDFGDEDVYVEVKGITRGANIQKRKISEDAMEEKYVRGFLQSGAKFVEFSAKVGTGLERVLSLFKASSESGVEVTIKGRYNTVHTIPPYSLENPGHLTIEEVYLSNVGVGFFLPTPTVAERIKEFFGGGEEDKK